MTKLHSSVMCSPNLRYTIVHGYAERIKWNQIICHLSYEEFCWPESFGLLFIKFCIDVINSYHSEAWCPFHEEIHHNFTWCILLTKQLMFTPPKFNATKIARYKCWNDINENTIINSIYWWEIHFSCVVLF